MIVRNGLNITLSVSLDCPFFIVPSVFSNVYLYGSNKPIEGRQED